MCGACGACGVRDWNSCAVGQRWCWKLRGEQTGVALDGLSPPGRAVGGAGGKLAGLRAIVTAAARAIMTAATRAIVTAAALPPSLRGLRARPLPCPSSSPFHTHT